MALSLLYARLWFRQFLGIRDMGQACIRVEIARRRNS